MTLRTPLYDWHAARGGVLVEFGGWMLPIRYSTITEEHHAVRREAGLFDISHMGRLSFSGPGALPLIEKAFTNIVATMKEGQVRYGLVCNPQGGIHDDVLVYRWSHGWSMVVNASNRSKIVDHLKGQSAGLDVAMEDQTESTCMLALQGPKALAMCAGMFDGDPSALKYYYAIPTRYKEKACIVSRTGYTGEDGLEVAIAANHARELADDFMARGARPCGLGARDTLRLEAAMPLYGHELSEEIDPIQAGLGWAVKLEKGDFVGRDALIARKADASRPVRVGLTLEGRRAAREGAAVTQAGQPVGKVTSGTITPTLGRAIAMAYVAPAAAAPGTVLEVSLGSATVPATVVPLPFYRRS